MSDFHVYTDGGARGNPGPAGAGASIQAGDGSVIEEIARGLGTATNNQAEYWAAIFALEAVERIAKERGLAAPAVRLHADSQLMVEQMKGNYKVKNEGIRPLYVRLKSLIEALGGNVTFTHIARRENSRADELANKAMDEVEYGAVS